VIVLPVPRGELLADTRPSGMRSLALRGGGTRACRSDFGTVGDDGPDRARYLRDRGAGAGGGRVPHGDSPADWGRPLLVHGGLVVRRALPGARLGLGVPACPVGSAQQSGAGRGRALEGGREGVGGAANASSSAHYIGRLYWSPVHVAAAPHGGQERREERRVDVVDHRAPSPRLSPLPCLSLVPLPRHADVASLSPRLPGCGGGVATAGKVRPRAGPGGAARRCFRRPLPAPAAVGVPCQGGRAATAARRTRRAAPRRPRPPAPASPPPPSPPPRAVRALGSATPPRRLALFAPRAQDTPR